MSTDEATTGQTTDETIQADERDARADHRADRGPTPEEERAAEGNADLDPASAEAYREAIERGADVEGEGKIDL
jgi:hypothetical protein